MSAEIISLGTETGPSSEVRRAAQALADGALVIFPTETVYGLAANAANAESVRRLRDLKGRSNDQPFTVHIGTAIECEEFVPQVGRLGRMLMRKAWPGPLTLIFQVSEPKGARAYERLSEEGASAVYRNNTVGVRFPDHPIAETLLADVGVPVIASSANMAGGAAPTHGDEIAPELADKVDFIIDAGATRFRKPSTIVAVEGDGYRVIRTGVWDERTIRRLSTLNILFVCTGNTCRSPMAEAIGKKMLAEQLHCEIEDLPSRGIIVLSAGTGGFPGSPVSPEAVEVCSRRGANIPRRSAVSLSTELIQSADHIFAMARHHVDAIDALLPGSRRKTRLLDPSGDVDDPIGGPIEAYEKAADRISEALKERTKEVLA